MLAATGAIVLTCAAPAGAAITVTQRISVTASGQQANGESRFALISADGRYVAFDSAASNLVAGDANGVTDVFELDLATGVIERVNVSSAGAEANSEASAAGISNDGRYVTFLSYASNLVPGDNNGFADVFVHDRVTGATHLVDRSTAGQQAQGGDTASGGAISADGRYVTFDSSAANLVAGDTNGAQDVFVRDRTAGTTQRVSVAGGGGQADDESFASSISADGRSVAFASFADNLVPGDTNGTTDVFVRDRTAGTTTRVSSAPTAARPPRRAACSSAARAR
jgi:Tol biopolymer transport system component